MSRPEVDVAARLTKRGAHSIAQPGAYVVLSARDNGTGIDAATMAKIQPRRSEVPVSAEDPGNP